MKNMKHIFRFLTTLTIIVLLSSFTTTRTFTGTYGVSSADPSQIKLSIQADHTFTYQDFSVAGNTIEVKGTWSMKGKKVVLKSDDATAKFHRVWSFDEGGKIARSRRGLCWYRLCKLE